MLLFADFFITPLYLNGTLMLRCLSLLFRNFVKHVPDFAQVCGKYYVEYFGKIARIPCLWSYNSPFMVCIDLIHNLWIRSNLSII